MRSRRLMTGLALALAWFGFTVRGSHALFSDSASLTGESIIVGSTDLQVSNSQNGSSTLYADSRPGFAHHMNPGSGDANFFFLKNVAPSEISLRIEVRAVGSQAMAEDLLTNTLVGFVPVDSTGALTGTLKEFTLEELVGGVRSLEVVIKPGTAQRMKLLVSLGSAFTRQGETGGYDLVFTGVQALDS